MKFDLKAKLTLFFISGCFVLSLPLLAADPPNRIIRASSMSDNVSFSPAGENEWSNLTLNRPLYIGDRLWSLENSQTELQTDGSSFCLGGNTSLSILNVDDNLMQVKVTEGRLNLFIRYLEPNQVYEIDTPNLAFTIRQPGYYQVNVSANDNSTMTSVQNGSAEVYGVENAYKINTGKAFQFYGEDLKDFEAIEIVPDNFDNWCMRQSTRGESGLSVRHVSKNIIGYEDLDRYGQWVTSQDYGTVWAPSEVSADWAPYSDGSWSWIEPWGWTWIDEAPWGFAPYHYGRWAFAESRWFWVPGPVAVRAYYAPALVAFIGGEDFAVGLTLGGGPGIGWFPLGPNDVYIPPYFVSHNYFTNINLSNTAIINRGIINNIYNHPRRGDFRYQNLGLAANAVTVVPREVFRNAGAVRGSRMKLTPEQIRNAKVAAIPAIAPTQTSLIGASKATRVPPKALVDKQVIAKTKAPLQPAAFATKQEALSKQPGKPLENTRAIKKGETLRPTNEMKVVSPQARAKEIPGTAREREANTQRGLSERGAREQPSMITPPSQRSIPTQEPGRGSAAQEEKSLRAPRAPREEPRAIRPSEQTPNISPSDEKRGQSGAEKRFTRPQERPALMPREERRFTPKEDRKAVIPREDKVPTPSTERRVITPPAERRVITPPAERRVITPPAERRVITPPAERRVITPPAERRVITPPAERRVITPPAERRVITPPAERRVITPPQERPSIAPREERRVPEQSIQRAPVPRQEMPRSVPQSREVPREVLRQNAPSREMAPRSGQQGGPVFPRDRDNRENR